MSIEFLFPGDQRKMPVEQSESVVEMMNAMMRSRRISITDWMPLVGTEFRVRLRFRGGTPYLLFKKDYRIVYITALAFGSAGSSGDLEVVSRLYRKFRTEPPPVPKRQLWIHMIPVNGTAMLKSDVVLIQRVSMFVYTSIVYVMPQREEEVFP